jgi:hypothetical protein
VPNTNDGGQWALAGYLYQMVGLLAMHAQANCPSMSARSEELAALLKLVPSGRIHHEYLGQDAVLRQLGVSENDTLVLVQFKYSTQQTPPKITPSQLLEIIDQLHASTQQALALGENVTGYALITNRNLSPQAARLRQSVVSSESPSSMKDDQLRILRQLRFVTDLPLRAIASKFGPGLRK